MGLEIKQIGFWHKIDTHNKGLNFFETFVSWSGKRYRFEHLKDLGDYKTIGVMREKKWKSRLKNIARVVAFIFTLGIPLIIKSLIRRSLKNHDIKIKEGKNKTSKEPQKSEQPQATLHEIKKIQNPLKNRGTKSSKTTDVHESSQEGAIKNNHYTISQENPLVEQPLVKELKETEEPKQERLPDSDMSKKSKKMQQLETLEDDFKKKMDQLAKLHEKLETWIRQKRRVNERAARTLVAGIIEEAFKKNSKELTIDISLQGTFDELPPCVSYLSELEELELKGSLKSLPEGVGELKKLKKIDLFGNQFETLPKPLCSLPNLEHLILGDNKLKSLPQEMTNMKNLKKIDLYGNQFETLPIPLCSLTNLQELDLCNNSLKSLPGEISRLEKLQEINLSMNQLKTLPKKINDIESLRSINLKDNPIESLPHLHFRIRLQVDPYRKREKNTS